jgi:Cu/Ag efflux pump CusA
MSSKFSVAMKYEKVKREYPKDATSSLPSISVSLGLVLRYTLFHAHKSSPSSLIMVSKTHTPQVSSSLGEYARR